MIKKKSILPMLLGVLMCFSPTVAHAAPKDIATVIVAGGSCLVFWAAGLAYPAKKTFRSG